MYGDGAEGAHGILIRSTPWSSVESASCRPGSAVIGTTTRIWNESLRNKGEAMRSSDWRRAAGRISNSGGMLDDTLVIWGGEFGRTPTVEVPMGLPNNLYGNEPRSTTIMVYTMWLAGGGVKGGYVHGATDEFGFQAVDQKVHVHDLHATILHLLGFDHTRLTYRHASRDFRLTDVYGEVVHDLIA